MALARTAGSANPLFARKASTPCSDVSSRAYASSIVLPSPSTDSFQMARSDVMRCLADPEMVSVFLRSKGCAPRWTYARDATTALVTKLTTMATEMTIVDQSRIGRPAPFMDSPSSLEPRLTYIVHRLEQGNPEG